MLTILYATAVMLCFACSTSRRAANHNAILIGCCICCSTSRRAANHNAILIGCCIWVLPQ
eukprot:scaffold6472_cov208-Alexandrium_tamarense.AAC.3